VTLPAATVWEVRSSGSDTLCSGGFVNGASGTDYSQQAAAQYNAADLAVDATLNTKVTSASHNFVAADVGNILRITAGAGWTTGFYQIVSVAANAATLDRSPAATSTTGGTYYVGGAFASPGQAGAAHVGGNYLYVKSGTYTITSASNNVAGGCVSLTAGVTANQTRLIGYGSSRGDNGAKPLLQASGIATFTMITTAAGCRVDNLSLDGALLTSSRGINISTSGGEAYRCKIANCTNSAIVGNSSCLCVLCEATGCSTQPVYSGGAFFACTAHDNTVTAFSISGFSQCAIACIAANNTGAGSIGFNGMNNGFVIDCVAYGNGSHGFSFTATVNSNTAANCLAVNNGGFGFNSATYDCGFLYNCAGFNNTSGNVASGIPAANQIGFITLTGDPFANAAGNDFSLNSTAGAGAACRAAGIPGSTATLQLPGLSTLSYPDVGAAQHADPVSGGVNRSLLPSGLSAMG
jgi:hypothetical protein